jgi:hypothetical protein
MDCDSVLGFGLDIGFVDHFNTQLLITLNYTSIADFHTSQITTSPPNFFQPAVLSQAVPGSGF